MDQKKKATVLEDYKELKKLMDDSMSDSQVTLEQLWMYQELMYRISVIEALKAYIKSAPLSMDEESIYRHFQLFVRFLQHLINERKFKDTSLEEIVKQQQTAYESLKMIASDHRERMNSYSPDSDNQYKDDLSNIICTILPSWLQYRNTMIEIKIKKKEETN